MSFASAKNFQFKRIRQQTKLSQNYTLQCHIRYITQHIFKHLDKSFLKIHRLKFPLQCRRGNSHVLLEFCTVEPVLRDHCHERPPVLKDQIFLAEGPIFSIQLNLSPKTTCLERPHFHCQWGGLSRQVLLYNVEYDTFTS